MPPAAWEAARLWVLICVSLLSVCSVLLAICVREALLLHPFLHKEMEAEKGWSGHPSEATAMGTDGSEFGSTRSWFVPTRLHSGGGTGHSRRKSGTQHG
jgi:hypothetical protein